jgi:myo-inositol-1(or 4)-monophosphatase
MAAVRSPLINVMTRAAERAGRSMLRDFGEVEQLQVSRKGPADFVSAVDRRAEDILRSELSKARPGVGFLMEESGQVDAAPGEDRRWIVDPLDGTTNFLHGIAHFAVSVALEQAGELVAGVVYNPVADQMYWAERGQGAYLNDRRLRVSARSRLADALIATGVPFKGHGDPERFASELGQVMGEVAGIRRFGSAALDLAFVAAGRYDGFWERDLHAWDIAAGLLLVREAGGYVTEIEGGRRPLETGNLLATNTRLHTHLARLLSQRPGGRAAPPGEGRG